MANITNLPELRVVDSDIEVAFRRVWAVLQEKSEMLVDADSSCYSDRSRMLTVYLVQKLLELRACKGIAYLFVVADGVGELLWIEFLQF